MDKDVKPVKVRIARVVFVGVDLQVFGIAVEGIVLLIHIRDTEKLDSRFER